MSNLKKIIIFISFTVIPYILLNFNDTEIFQVAMNWIFKGLFIEPTGFWLQNRLLIITVIVLLLIFYYKSIFSSYKTIIDCYKNIDLTPQKPTLPIQQSNYMLLHDKSSSFAVWLIEMCQSGSLNLHFDKKKLCWSISKNPDKSNISTYNQQLLGALFITEQKIELDASLDNEITELKLVSNRLYKNLEQNNAALLKKKKSSLPGWIFLILLFMEIPFLSSINSTPGLTIISIALAISTGFLVYGFNYLLTLFNGHYLKSAIFLIIPAFIVSIMHFSMSSINNGGFYFLICFYPNIVSAIALMVYLAPKLPKDMYLLQQIIGYKKYLKEEVVVTEQELNWRLALAVQVDDFELDWTYKDRKPAWLISNETNLRQLIYTLHLSFPESIKKCIQ
jgi:hypothetical protein